MDAEFIPSFLPFAVFFFALVTIVLLIQYPKVTMLTCTYQSLWGRFQSILNTDGLFQIRTKVIAEQMTLKLNAHQISDDSSDVYPTVQNVVDEILRDILDENPSLNKAVLQLICGFLGKYAFIRDVASNEHRYRLFKEFTVKQRAVTEECSSEATQDLGGKEAFFAVHVQPKDVPFVFQNAVNAPNKALHRRLQCEDEDSALDLFQTVFMSQNENEVISWTAPPCDSHDDSRDALTGCFSRDIVHRTYLLTKPKRAEVAMYGVMHIAVIPSGLKHEMNVFP